MTFLKCPNCDHRFEIPHAGPAGVADRAPPENPARLMRHVAKLHREKGLTTTAIAKIVGKNQPHVSKLILIEQRVDAAVLKLWEASWEENGGRPGPFRVPIEHMRNLGADALARELSAREQMAEYRHLCERAELTKAHQRDRHAVQRRRLPKRTH